jgi:uncharacterized protein YndB with AHSA1/START domain
MPSFTGQSTAVIDAPPGVVFAAVTDVERLPEWNRRIVGVAERPAALVEGAEWVVDVRVAGNTFRSRSVVIEIDPLRRRFVHRSKRDDRNASHTIWTWEVEPEADGSRLTLAWDLRPSGFLRRRVLAPVRARHFARGEVDESLAALRELCSTSTT